MYVHIQKNLKKKLKFLKIKMPSPSRRKRRATYFSRQNYRYQKRREWQKDHPVSN